MRQWIVGKVAGVSGKTRLSVMAVVTMAFLIIGFFVVDGVFPKTATAAGAQLMHNSVNTGTGKYGTWGVGYTCATCHNKKAKNNIKYVNYTIATPTGKRRVIFDRYTATSNAVTGVFGNDLRTNYVDGSRNVCEVCHHQTIYHNYSATKIASISLTHPEHNSNKKDCNACHKHNLGYRAPSPGQCTDCHGFPPTSPATMVAGSNSLGLSPPADAGAHNRHRNIEGMECHTCHNNFGHGLLGNSMIEIGFRIDKKTWAGFSGISTVMSGTFTGTIGAPFNDDYAVAPGNPGTTLLRVPSVTSCSIYCHGDNWSIPSGRVGTGVSWVQGPLGSCSVAACHGTTSANPPTPSIATGAHLKHVGTLQQPCTACHDDYSNPHMVNGRVKWNLTNQGPAATYKGFAVHSTSKLPGVDLYGSCDGIYCHSNVQSGAGTGTADVFKPVTWGGTTLNCDGCHGGKRGDSSPIASGAHAKHISAYSYVCGDCHSGAGADGSIMNHLNSNIEVAFNTYSGSYDQMPTNTPGNGYGNCTANYCHSDGKGSKKSVSWGTAGPLACNACHKADQAGNAVNSGKHTAHVDNAAFLGSNYGCVICHANTVSDNVTISNTSKHVNKFGDYSGARAGRYTAATGVCSASYCHSDGKGGAPAVAVGWKDGSVINDCKGCHGNSTGGTFVSASGEPNYANTGADTTFANSHDRHMGGVGLATCVYCHNDTVSDTGLKTNTFHLNGSKNIAAGGGKSFTYLGNRTCSNISCHGGPSSIKWGQTLPVDCTGCHGNNALSFAPISSGKHKAHMNNETVLGKNNRCATCHALTANSDDRSIADASVHGNGFKNYTGSLAGSRNSYNLTTGVCSASYCHTDGKGVQNVPFTSLNGWKSIATLDCAGCHGNSSPADFISTYGEPNYVSAGAGTLRANDHKNHVDSGAASCVFCHADTVTVTGSVFLNASTHVNRRIDVKAGNGKTFIYSAGKTCSDISCHGGKGSFTKVWGTPVTADCTGCHGNNAVSFAPISSGRHKAHINNADLGVNYNCTACHAKTINADERTFLNPNLHGNGFIDYSGVRAGKSTTYDTATGACSASYCHTDGKGAQNVAFGLANGWKSATVYSNCVGCHGNDTAPAFVSTAGEPNYPNAGESQPRANSHERHMGGVGGTTCVYCHNDTVTAAGALMAGTFHTNRSRDVAAGGGKSFSYDFGTRTCSNISCHGGPSPARWGQLFPADCTGCHGNNALSFAPISSGKHKAHINNKTVLGKDYACANCHALTANPDDRSIGDASVHGNGFKNYTSPLAGSRSSYTTATGVCSASYCHTDGKGQQNVTFSSANGWKSPTAVQLDCTGCHGNNSPADFASVNGEPNYASTGAGTARANSHKNHVDSGADSCVFCHSATVTAAGAIIQDSTSHVLNKTIDVIAGGGKTFVYGAGKNCSDISCHGGKGSFTQTWGAPISADCTGCHGNNAVSFAPISSGRHKSHINNAATLGTNYNCTECHAKTVNADERSFADRNLHGNGFVDYSGARAGKSSSYDTATGACSASYCHTDGKGAQNVAFGLGNGWKSTTVYGNCIGCHGNNTPADFTSIAGEPNYATQGAGLLRANSHNIHVGADGATTCYSCHADVVGVTGTTVNTKHINRFTTYSSSGVAGKTFTRGAGKTCSNIACHGSGSPAATWGDTLGCSGCHGGNAGNDPITTGKHTAHINNPDIGNNLGCADCHAQVVNTDTSFSNRALHVDGFANYSGANAGKNKATCNAAYCHSNGKGVAGTAIDWNTSPAFTNCVGCHGTATGAGTFISQAGEPNYQNQVGLFANSHQSHASAGASSCDTCHINTVVPAGTAIKSGSLHLNSSINVDFNTSKAGLSAWYDAPNKTCNNISCHGSGTPKWGDASTAGCTACHPNLSATHAKHVGDLFTSGSVTFYNFTANRSVGSYYRFGCANCHPTDPAKHRNSTIDITLNKNKAGAGFLVTLNNLVSDDTSGYTNGGANNITCETVYCHSNGRTLSLVAGDYKQTPNWYGDSFGSNRCGGCHDNPPKYAGQSHYVAESSMGNNGSSPYKESGHMVGIHFRNNSRGNNLNGFLGYSSSGSMAHGNPAMATTISCYTCHSGIVSSTQIDTYAMTGTGSYFRCANCHTSNSRTPLQPGQIVNTALHINGAKNVAFAPITFKTKAQLANVANALGWSRNSNYKADDSYDSSDLSISTWDVQTKTCLTACHVNQPSITWGAQLKCMSCHANQ